MTGPELAQPEQRDPEAAAIREALERLYARVPATRCAQCGSCCQLTEEEYRRQYATMFPLYRAEYASIAAFVRAEFDPERAAAALQFTEERPWRCPFLGADNGCAIYPVRPLICRTYGVMNAEFIAAAVARNRDSVPPDWLRRFARREADMACPRVTVTEPDKVALHADRLVTSEYARCLGRLGERVQLTDPTRLDAFAAITGRRALPVRWSWGGYNAVCGSSVAWLRASFRKYWSRAVLADAV